MTFILVHVCCTGRRIGCNQAARMPEWQHNTLLSTFVFDEWLQVQIAAIIEIVCQYFFMDYELALAGALCKV
jgi:hypothetical protein